MKKFFFLAIALAVCAFTFVSCEKEKDKDNTSDSNYAQAIVGTWQFARYWDSEDKEWYDDVDHFLLIFDAKGNLTWDYRDGEPYTYKYHIEKDVIYIGDEEDGDNWKNWEATYRISSISSSKMVLMYVDGEGNDKLEFEKQ